MATVAGVRIASKRLPRHVPPMQTARARPGHRVARCERNQMRGRASVTTLPAKAGSFWHQPEASAQAGASRTTLTATRYVSVRRPDPGLLLKALMSRRTSPELVVLPSRGEVVNAISTAEHLTEPRLPRTRDMSYPRACPVEPPKRIVHVKVLVYDATSGLACQATRRLRGPSPAAIRLPLRAARTQKPGVPCGGFLWE